MKASMAISRINAKVTERNGVDRKVLRLKVVLNYE